MRQCKRCSSSIDHRHGLAQFCSDYCRFWDKVNIGGLEQCWEWTRTRLPHGHGVFNTVSNGKQFTQAAHRWVWNFVFGKIPKQLQVLHKCAGGGNAWCCNPIHLYLGTQLQNIKDRDDNGRQVARIGVDHGNAVINDDIVRAVRKEREVNGTYFKELDKMFGLSSSHSFLIVKRKIWKHVD